MYILITCCIVHVGSVICFLFNSTASSQIYPYSHTLSLHAALPIYGHGPHNRHLLIGRAHKLEALGLVDPLGPAAWTIKPGLEDRSEEHTSELHALMRISYAVF